MFTFKYMNEQEVIALRITLSIVGIFIVGLRFITQNLEYRAHNGAFGSPTPATPSGLSPEKEELYTDPLTTFDQKGAYGSIKLSIIAFYRRIFVVSKNDAFNRGSKISATIIFL
ncbi:hypothetical protein BELL_1150g00020 [Botrytis elliptica]|uniref:Uncharacterized protein n=1 Tax=Botrytis elliptica TaxID=278938 RepID=A0A4Z1IXV3_9HELO|nr:hypothetical protein EAE99_011599 [Botrytis elliptica]TGO61653.1 hypothetical protein BELL_1150g00020 [Botrytis elliptica]